MNDYHMLDKKLGNTYQMSLDSFLKEPTIDHSLNSNYESALKKLKEMNQYRSWPKKQKIAQEALSICEECIEAYIAYGLYHEDIFETVKIYKKGMELATMAFGKEYFQRPTTDFYDESKTHPLFHIKYAYACVLFELGFMKKAKDQFAQILSLNPGDHFQVRYYLYTCYLYFEEYEKCFNLYEKYHQNTTMDLYVKFLYFYKQGLLQEAMQMIPFLEKSNLYLYEILTYQRNNSYMIDKTYAPGSQEEANFCALILKKVCSCLDYLPKYLCKYRNVEEKEETNFSMI